MFLPARRVRGVWIGLVLLVLTPFSAIAVSPAQKFPRCCVWRVTNAEAPFYLVGSVHALSRKDYPLPVPYEIALKDARRLLFEFDPTQHAEFEKKFERAAKYPPGQDIRSKIHPDLLAWLRENITTANDSPRHGKRPRAGSFDSGLGYKPWWIAQHLVGPATYSNGSASHGLDDYFVASAKRSGKEIAGLESVDEHVAVLAGLSDRDGEIILRNALAPRKNSTAEF